MIRSIQVAQFNNLIPDIQDKKIIITQITYGDKIVKYLESRDNTDIASLFKTKTLDSRKPKFEEFNYFLFYEEGGEEMVGADTVIDLHLKDDVDDVIEVPGISEPTPEELAEIIKQKEEAKAKGEVEEEEELY